MITVVLMIDMHDSRLMSVQLKMKRLLPSQKMVWLTLKTDLARDKPCDSLHDGIV